MKKIFFIFIRVYQSSFGLIFPKACRFYPSCSHYTLQAVEKFGFVRGLLKAGFRVLRCNPFSKGGYDPA